MASETYRMFTKSYAELRNLGIENKSDITEWEYDWANLSYPDGFEPDESDFEILSRRDKKLKIIDFKKNY